ncbi:hypothetical protein D3C84_984500 [compost metagenome]
MDQADEPARHTVDFRGGAAFQHRLVILDVNDADGTEVTAVKNGTDHQLHHRRVIDLRRQGQSQGSGCILGMGAQLAERLLARAFQADEKTAAERHQQEQADGQKQLFAQCHEMAPCCRA